MNTSGLAQKYDTPKTLPPNRDLMSPAMTVRPQWVGVKIVPTGNPDRRLDKIPINPRTGREAKTNDSTTWGTFAEAWEAMKTYGLGGVGYVMSADDPFTVIDLDKCVDPITHAIAPEAMATVERFGSLAEYSGSGTGIHIFVEDEGKLPPKGRKGNKVECYNAVRLVWMTGCPLVGYETIRPAGDELAAWHAEHFPPKPQAPRPAQPVTPVSVDTQCALDRVVKTVKGRTLHDNGDWKGSGYDNQSEADMGLCNLYVAAGASRSQVDDLFRRSRLMRDKWDKQHYADGRTYGDGTLDKAFDGTVQLWDIPKTADPDPEPDVDVPSGSPCGAQIERLQQHVTRLTHELDQKDAEIADLRERNSLIISIVTNPHLKAEAAEDLATGMRAAGALERPVADRPAERAAFFAVLAGLRDALAPRDGLEDLLVQQMASAYELHLRWQQVLVRRMEEDVWHGERDKRRALEGMGPRERERYQELDGWLPPRVSDAAAVEQAAILADRFQRSFLRLMKAFRDNRRLFASLIVTGGQVNVGEQQVNVAN